MMYSDPETHTHTRDTLPPSCEDTDQHICLDPDDCDVMVLEDDGQIE